MQPAQPITPVLLSIPDAAILLDATPAALRKWLGQRRLPVVKLGRLTRLRRSDLEAVIAKGELPPMGAHPRNPRTTKNGS
jgi:excisionase family DNA binding protein